MAALSRQAGTLWCFECVPRLPTLRVARVVVERCLLLRVSSPVSSPSLPSIFSNMSGQRIYYSPSLRDYTDHNDKTRQAEPKGAMAAKLSGSGHMQKRRTGQAAEGEGGEGGREAASSSGRECHF